MPRNFSRLVMVLGAALLAGAPSLHAQAGQPVRGDVDGDGRVTATDARIISDFLVGKPVPAGANVRERGDVNGDGRVTSVDAAIIARAAAGRDVSRFPVGTPVTDDANGMATLTCHADLRAGTVSCGDSGGTGQAADPNGPRALRFAGDSNGVYVKFTTTNLHVDSVPGAPGDTTFAFDVVFQNRIPQSIGTTNNVNADVDSIRVFFTKHPTPNGIGDNGNIIVDSPVGVFTAANQHYYQFPGFLTPGATTPASRRFHFTVHGRVTTFDFKVAIAAAVEYPAGWVDIYRPGIPKHLPSPYLTYADTLLVGEVDSLRAIVRNPIGDSVTASPPVSWGSNNDPVATVGIGTGVVTADSVGTALITAQSNPQRIGHFSIVVTTASTDSTTITAADATRTVGDSTLVTVQVKDQFGRNVGVGSPYVPAITLITNLGTLRGTAAASDSITPVDGGNGTYTAWLKSNTSGTATVTGKIGVANIVDNAVVTFNASVPFSIEKVEPLTRDTVNPGSAVPTDPRVRVRDVHGNPVPNASVTLLASGGSTVSPVGPLTTNASGEAAVTSWTIDTEGLKTLTASAGTATDVVFEAYGNMAPLAGRDSIDAIGNVQVTATGLKLNDTDPENETLTITSLTPNTPTGAGGTVTFTAGGGVTYNSMIGFTGLDSATYTVSDPRGRTATGKLMIRVPDRVWYVQGGGSGNGSQSSPSGNFTFGAALAAKDSIFLLSSATVPSGVTLPNGGALIGAGAATITRSLGHSPDMAVPDVTLLTNGSPPPTLTVSTGTGVTLTSGGTGYIVKGLSLTTSSGAGISGSNFGTLDLGTTSINSTGGAALALTTGTLSGGSTSVTASGGTNNIALSGVTLSGGVSLGSGALSGASGSALLITNGISAGVSDVLSYSGSISNATANATVAVTGGTTRLLLTGNVSQTGSGAAVSASGGHTGTLTFNTGTVSASNGTGLQFSDADGSYAFNGTTTLNGGDAGVDVLAGSGGTFSFAAGASITNPSGAALFVDASAPTLTYAGSISTGPASGRPVHVQGMTGGSVGVSGAVSSTGQGILVQNNTGGSTTFSAGKTLNTGTNAAVTLATNAGHAVSFTNGNLAITTTSGTGFAATGSGSFTVTGSGNDISTGSGAAISLANVTVGAAGMVLGTVSSTGATNAVSLTNVTGTGTITSTGGTLTGVAAGATFLVSGGSANVTWGGGITQGANNALLSVSGGHTGTLTFNTGTLSASNGTGLQFDNADGSYDFGSSPNLSLAGGDAAIDVLNGSGGTFTFASSAAITNPTGEAVRINSSSPTFTYPGRITKTNGSTGITVSSSSAGTISFGSRLKTITSTGGNVAVNLATNGTATITSVDSLVITSATGNGYNATGGGTVAVTGANNTITSVGGVALNVSSTTIGASGLTFRSISANGGGNGIMLSGTGTSGGLTVTGDGSTNGSGGTIVNTTGADGATTGNGIYLSGARNVKLNWMALSGHANNGLFGTGVRGLTLDHVRFTGNNGTSNSGTFDESAMRLVDAGGAMKFTNSRFDGGAFNGVSVENITGTAPVLDSLVFAFDTVTFMQGSTVDVRSTALLVNLMDGSADTRFRNNYVTYWWGNAIHVLVQGTATGTTRISNNFADNTNGALAGAGGIWLAGGAHTFNISSNTIRNTNGTAISVENTLPVTMQGTIDGNNIGQSGVAGSGPDTGIGIFAANRSGTSIFKISNNVLRQIGGSADGAITVRDGDALAFGGSGTINATVSGNNIQESSAPVNNAQQGILITHGTQSGPPNDTHQGCFDILSNTVINFTSGSANNRIRVNQRFGTTSRWPGYTGAALGVTSQTDMAAYLLARNTASTSTNANTSTGGFLNTSPAGSACPQPSL